MMLGELRRLGWILSDWLDERPRALWAVRIGIVVLIVAAIVRFAWVLEKKLSGLFSDRTGEV